MTIFGAVVQPGTGFNEDVLDVGELGDLRLYGWIAPQLIGHNLAERFGTGGKHAPEKPLRRSLVATLLQEDIKLCAVLIDCPPQQIRLAAQCHEYFVQMPCGAELATRRFHSVCKARTEFIAPAPDRFIAHNNPALEQQLFDVTKA